MCFVNLVDFDALWGTSQKCDRLRRGTWTIWCEIRRISWWIERGWSSDHYCRPRKWSHLIQGTDHTREYVPFISWSPAMAEGGRLEWAVNVHLRLSVQLVAYSMSKCRKERFGPFYSDEVNISESRFVFRIWIQREWLRCFYKSSCTSSGEPGHSWHVFCCIINERVFSQKVASSWPGSCGNRNVAYTAECSCHWQTNAATSRNIRNLWCLLYWLRKYWSCWLFHFKSTWFVNRPYPLLYQPVEARICHMWQCWDVQDFSFGFRMFILRMLEDR